MTEQQLASSGSEGRFFVGPPVSHNAPRRSSGLRHSCQELMIMATVEVALLGP